MKISCRPPRLAGTAMVAATARFYRALHDIIQRSIGMGDVWVICGAVSTVSLPYLHQGHANPATSAMGKSSTRLPQRFALRAQTSSTC